MDRTATFAWLAGLALVLAAPGCRLMEPQASGKNALPPLAAMSESIRLEVYFAHFPVESVALNTTLWNDIDEQAFAPQLRRELADNGIRAGLVGSQVPVELARLLTLTDERPDSAQSKSVDLEAEPAVHMRLLAVRPGRRSEVVASSVYEQLPLLMREAGQVVGHTYHQAEGRFALRAFPQSDGRVRLELLPELHYGQPQQRWNAADGVIRLESARPKRAFEELRLKADIAPGQMIVLTCRPDRAGSLGHHFFTEPQADSLMQKMLVIRIAQAGCDRSFAETGATATDLPPEEGEPR